MRKDKHLEVLVNVWNFKDKEARLQAEQGELWAQTLGVSRAEMGEGAPLDHTCQSAWPRAVAP